MVGVPKWLTLRPNDKMEKLIKENSYNFIYRMAKRDGIDLKVVKLIPEYIAELNIMDAQFGKILPKQTKTTHDFIDAIRLELRNQKDKLEKEIANGAATLKSEEDCEDDVAEEDQDEEVQVVDEEEVEYDQEDEHQDSEEDNTIQKLIEPVPTATQDKPKIST